MKKIIILKENVNVASDGDRSVCNKLDIDLFNTLTIEEKISYTAGFEPTKDKKYNFVARYTEVK